VCLASEAAELFGKGVQTFGSSVVVRHEPTGSYTLTAASDADVTYLIVQVNLNEGFVVQAIEHYR
jgi:hypothetical protein